jgi:nicotinate-nucleotide adenylyltransferase
MNIGLFFGSFNPIHVGHLALANYFAEFADFNEIWFVVSPQNPLKINEPLLDNRERLKMVDLAIGGFAKFKSSDIEFDMPSPSYTSSTLRRLTTMHPGLKFSLIIGADNLEKFESWKDYEFILQNHAVYVYPRLGLTESSLANHPSIHFADAPVIEISASFIRTALKAGKDIQFFMPEKAYRYMREKHFYLE